MADRGETDTETGTENRRNTRGKVLLSGINVTFLMALATLLAIWFVAAHAVDRPFQFPRLESVLSELGYAFTDLYVWRNLGITFRRVLLGVLYATLIGFPLGMFMGYSKTAMKTISPFIAALRQIPMTSWVPLSIIWFGLGDGPSIFVIALVAVFTIILSTVSGVKDISPEYYNAVRSMGATTAGVIKDVVFPGCISGLITGMRIAFGLAWMTVVCAEFIATSTGFGFLIKQAHQDMITQRMIAYMLLAGIFGFAQDRVVLFAESRLLRWKG